MLTALLAKPATATDVPAIASILSDAFQDDPVCAWIWPDEVTRPTVSFGFFEVFARHTVGAGQTLIAEDNAGAAIWLPVDPSQADEDPEFDAEMGALAATWGEAAERFAILDELMKAAHPGHTAHAYLPLLGVARASQGKGVGSALLGQRARDLDATGTPAYLEATNLRNAALYERHGFRHLEKTIDLPGGPSLYPMWRDPAAR